MVESMEVDQVS